MKTDVIIIGAGGAGMMCAIHAGRRGRTVRMIDHSEKLGGKILISGGGRCNFTNTGASPHQYISKNHQFSQSAFARYPSEKFVAMVEEHGIAYHEKKLGQLFCDGSAQQIVNLLKKECDQVGADFRMGCEIREIVDLPEKLGDESRFRITTNQGEFYCESLVIATGGLSIPKIGATGFGYTVARKYGLNLIDRAAALDGFTLSSDDAKKFGDLAGVSVDSTIECNKVKFRENILFTHAGLSGPATLQASLHWYPGITVTVNILPDESLFAFLAQKKKEGSRALIKNLVSEKIPARLAERFCELYFKSTAPLGQVPDKELKFLSDQIHAWTFIPAGTVGYGKAEVTRGGVDTDELSSKTMEAKKVPGLYFIGEVVDVTGWLGGYNFQWAWASGAAAGASV